MGTSFLMGGVLSYITAHKLSVAFGLHPKTLDRWPTCQKPRQRVKGCYSYEDVNAWLARPGCAFGFVVVPTIERILSGKIKLIRREEATRMLAEALDLKDPVAFVRLRIYTGRLKALCLRPRSWLIPLESVELLIREQLAQTEGYGTREIHQICGIGVSLTSRGERRSNTLLRWAAAGEIEVFREGSHVRVRRQSLLRFVQRLIRDIYPPIDAEDWIDDRLSSPEPLLTITEAAERLGVLASHLHKLISSSEIHAIHTSGGGRGGKWFVSPESVAAYQQRAQPLTQEEIGRVFGAKLTAVRGWGREDLTCPLHGFESGCPLYRWCMVAYVRERAGNGVSAVSWVHNALSSRGCKILTSNAIVSGKIISRRRLMLAAQAGRIPSVLAPNGRVVYLLAAVLKEARRDK